MKPVWVRASNDLILKLASWEKEWVLINAERENLISFIDEEWQWLTIVESSNYDSSSQGIQHHLSSVRFVGLKVRKKNKFICKKVSSTLQTTATYKENIIWSCTIFFLNVSRFLNTHITSFYQYIPVAMNKKFLRSKYD